MSFTVDTTRTHCGLAALSYVLSLHGYGWHDGAELTLKQMRRLFHLDRLRVWLRGVNEYDIMRTASRQGFICLAHNYTQLDPDAVIADLRRAINQGHSCIVSWHDDECCHFHWVCVAGFVGDALDVLVGDPAVLDADRPRDFRLLQRDDYALGLMRLARFREWLTPSCPPSDSCFHYFVECVPQDDRASGLPQEDLIRLMHRDARVLAHYDEYLDDLHLLFTAPLAGARLSSAIAAADFIEEHYERLWQLARSWTLTPSCSESAIRRELDILQAFTRSYQFWVTDVTQALASLSFYLGWWACTHSYRLNDET